MNPVVPRLDALFGPRRAQLEHTIAWVFTDADPCLMDARAPALFTPGWRRDCDLTILTNQATAEALVAGQLDPEAPAPGQLFLCGGDPDALRSLGRCLKPVSQVDLRATKGGAR